MGESTCLMQSFSYASGLPNEANEGNPIHALGQSVSFGRFMSDQSLSWDKWSAFSSNRYVEEAERYARPGSVARKKAFFEAHYKSLAARKAAALVEQAKLQAQAEEEEEDADELGVDVPEVEATPATETKLPHDADMAEPTEVGPRTDGLKDEPVDKVKDVDHDAEAGDQELRGPIEAEDSGSKFEPSRGLSEATDSRKVLEELELSETSQMEKPLLKNLMSSEAGSEVTSQKRQVASYLRQPSYTRGSKLKPSPSPGKPLPSVRSKKENRSTPNLKKPSIVAAAERMGSTPKASQRSISFTPAKEFNKLTAIIMRKMDGSRASSNFKAANDCSTPLRTPTMGQVSISGRSKLPSATPLSDTKSVRKPLDSSASSVSKSVRARWSFLNTDCSKKISGSRNKSQSPGIFASFTLRTEERAARRKQKLEEKFNRSQTKNLQHQATLKAKAGTEMKNLNPSFCFKARPLPDFYKERSAKKQQEMQQEEEASLKRQDTPTLETYSTPSRESRLQRASSIPRERPSKKNFGSQQLPEKRNQDLAHSLRAKMAAHENIIL